MHTALSVSRVNSEFFPSTGEPDSPGAQYLKMSLRGKKSQMEEIKMAPPQWEGGEKADRVTENGRKAFILNSSSRGHLPLELI